MKAYYYQGTGVISEVNVDLEESTRFFYYCQFENGVRKYVDKYYVFSNREDALRHGIKTLKLDRKCAREELEKAQSNYQKIVNAINWCEGELEKISREKALKAL